MSIQSEIDRIADAKNASLLAVGEKGVNVNGSEQIGELPNLIRQIQTLQLIVAPDFPEENIVKDAIYVIYNASENVNNLDISTLDDLILSGCSYSKWIHANDEWVKFVPDSLSDLLVKEELPKPNHFVITEDMVTVTRGEAYGVAPYSTSYKMTYIEISEDAGVQWVEGASYIFVVVSNMIVNSTYRNVAVRIGSNDSWHPVMGASSVITGSTYFATTIHTTFYYKTSVFAGGALHLQRDSDTTYGYLVNTVTGDATGSVIKIDDQGYGARYSLIFATTSLTDSIGGNERYSSLVTTSSTDTSKSMVVPTSGKFYIDRQPLYINSANVAAGAKPINNLYQDYAGSDLRYIANTNSTYASARQKAFLWLCNFNEADLSFVANAGIGTVFTQDKINIKFPSTVEGDVYLYFLGYTTSNWYSLYPTRTSMYRIYKYTPSTGEMVVCDSFGGVNKLEKNFGAENFGKYLSIDEGGEIVAISAIPGNSGDDPVSFEEDEDGNVIIVGTVLNEDRVTITDEYINTLIDAKLGVIENGSY